MGKHKHLQGAVIGSGTMKHCMFYDPSSKKQHQWKHYGRDTSQLIYYALEDAPVQPM